MNSEAYFDYSYMIRQHPEDGSNYCNRGLCLAKMKKFSMAIEDLDISVELDPSPLHLFSRGSTFADFGRYDAAIEGLFLY
jgi:tetratricopeptide (TPR) repeat protein